MPGWIKVHRKIQEHWLWRDKPFDRRSAWIDMLLMANHDESRFLLGNELVEVKRGSFITSELKLMERWGWSKTKVRNFLKLLEKDKMILKNSDKKKTTIIIENYSDYQDKQTTEEPQENHKETTERPQENTNKNDKNDKNVKNDKNDKEDISTNDDEEKIPDEKLKKPKPKKDKYGEFEKVSLTMDEFNKLINSLGQPRTKEMIARLDTYKASTGKRYSSDYATILNWNRKDITEGKYDDKKQQSKPKPQPKQSNLTDLLEMINGGAFDE